LSGVYLKIFKRCGRGIEERFKQIQGIMASFGDGSRHFSSSGLVRRGVATTPTGDGPSGRGSRTQHALNVEIKGNKAILVEERWESIGLQ
jgi:hypothetical protein